MSRRSKQHFFVARNMVLINVKHNCAPNPFQGSPNKKKKVMDFRKTFKDGQRLDLNGPATEKSEHFSISGRKPVVLKFF